MAYVNQVYEEYTELQQQAIEDVVAKERDERADGTTADDFPEGLTKHLVLTAILSDFRGTHSEKDHLRLCIENLIVENTLEWVWQNRETITDTIEFHGFERKY